MPKTARSAFFTTAIAEPGPSFPKDFNTLAKGLPFASSFFASFFLLSATLGLSATAAVVVVAGVVATAEATGAAVAFTTPESIEAESGTSVIGAADILLALYKAFNIRVPSLR